MLEAFLQFVVWKGDLYRFSVVVRFTSVSNNHIEHATAWVINNVLLSK